MQGQVRGQVRIRDLRISSSNTKLFKQEMSSKENFIWNLLIESASTLLALFSSVFGCPLHLHLVFPN